MIPIFYIKSGNLSFGEKQILTDLEIFVSPGDRICLVGKNGSGKSSLLKVINNEYELDTGEIYNAPNLSIGYLKQDLESNFQGNIFDFILQRITDPENNKHLVDMMLEELKIDGQISFQKASGGQRRRAFLAQVLIAQPDILMLDEPTNHLDIDAIKWLEEYLLSYPGALITISHDRAFQENTSNKVWWIDRACVRKSERGFKHYDNWRDEVIQEEELKISKMNRKLDAEKNWLNTGVTGRRKRNQRRLAALYHLRQELSAHNAKLNQAKAKLMLDLNDEVKKTKFLVEANNLKFKYEDNLIINDFSIKIKKGEKIGIIGANGSGKSTLLKMITKNLTPDSGTINLANNINITYFDQHRSYLNRDDTLLKTLCPNGGDQVFVGGKYLHAAAYLKKFLFDPKTLFSKVATLSGGESNRLLLATMLIKPGNLLILDEPTNDLDIDTMEMLLELLADYDGTLLLVSHDRDFIERLVTRLLVFEKDQTITEIFGGYKDYLDYIKLRDLPVATSTNRQNKSYGQNSQSTGGNKNTEKSSNTLSYKYRRLLEVLPGEIAQIEKESMEIEAQLHNNEKLYLEDYDKFMQMTNRLQNLGTQYEEKLQQWLEIEEIKKSNS